MYYPKEFADKVRARFSNFSELLNQLDSGGVMLGRFLCDNATNSISAPFVLAPGRTFDEVKAAAKSALASMDLYGEWCNLYDHQMGRK